MRYRFLVLIFVAFIACKKDEIKIEIVACFDYTPVKELQTGDVLTFLNCSENATNYLWDFGDGTVSDSETPDHSFENGGNYVVKLTATNGNFNDTISKNIQITDKYFTNLNDTSLQANRWGFDNNKIDYMIDIDKDTVDDLLITVFTYYSSSYGSENYVEITPLNGYQIAFTDTFYTTWHWNPDITDTIFTDHPVAIPRVYNFEDYVSGNDSYTINRLKMSYSQTNSFIFSPYNSNVYYGIRSEDDYSYIGFRQMDNNKIKVGWLKFKLLTSSQIILNSCRYVENNNSIKIE